MDRNNLYDYYAAVKPLVINVGETERIKRQDNKNFEDAVLVRYTNTEVDDRMAGCKSH